MYKTSPTPIWTVATTTTTTCIHSSTLLPFQDLRDTNDKAPETVLFDLPLGVDFPEHRFDINTMTLTELDDLLSLSEDDCPESELGPYISPPPTLSETLHSHPRKRARTATSVTDSTVLQEQENARHMYLPNAKTPKTHIKCQNINTWWLSKT